MLAYFTRNPQNATCHLHLRDSRMFKGLALAVVLILCASAQAKDNGGA